MGMSASMRLVLHNSSFARGLTPENCVVYQSPLVLDACNFTTARNGMECRVSVESSAQAAVSDVVVSIQVVPKCLVGPPSAACGPSAVVLAALGVSLTLSPAPALQSVTAVVQTTATVTAAVTTASLSIRASAAGDAQTMAVLSSSPCSSASARKQASASRYMLSPFVDFGDVAVTCGNLGIIVVIVAVQIAIVRKRSQGPEDVAAQCGRVYFPSLAIASFGFFYQGTALASLRLLLGSPTGATIVGLVGAVLVLMVPVAGTVLIPRLVGERSEFRRYPLQDANPSLLVRRFYPCGFWGPSLARRMFGSVRSKLIPRSTRLMFYPMFV